MSIYTPSLSLPLLQQNQAQKHVTHNEALQILDAVIQPHVASTDLTAPPENPVDGVCYIPAAGATGDWIGHDNQLAYYTGSAWIFHPPVTGWTVWDSTKKQHLVYNEGTNWEPAVSNIGQLSQLGINTIADETNRLSVASPASLLTHDGAGHQSKINKNAPSDTASLVFQTGFSGRAEMGTIGTDDFAIKVSPDGNNFHIALQADPQTGHAILPAGATTPDLQINRATTSDPSGLHLSTTGVEHARLQLNSDQGVQLDVSTDGTNFHNAFFVDPATGMVDFPNGANGLTTQTFGDGPLLTTDYAAAKGVDLVVNGSGLLGNNYNYPSDFIYDPLNTPNLPAAFSYAGYYPGVRIMEEFLPVDPNKIYHLQTYLRQEGNPTHTSHGQYMGLIAYDTDKFQISAHQHMRFYSNGTDSLTTLTQPLSPGDTEIHLASAAGWNDTLANASRQGIIIFGYKNQKGGEYNYYSRLVFSNIFDLSGVDKTNHVITLTAPLSTAAANPDDPNGTWPAGTSLANSSNGGTYKYALLGGHRLAQTDTWYHASNHMGGIDKSGTNANINFPPGTAYVKVFWLPNYSNRVGGYGSIADTGADHRIWFSGVSVLPDPLAARETAANGSVAIKVPDLNFSAGTLSLRSSGLRFTALD